MRSSEWIHFRSREPSAKRKISIRHHYLLQPHFGNHSHFKFKFANFRLIGRRFRFGWLFRLFGLPAAFFIIVAWFLLLWLLIIGTSSFGSRGIEIQPRLQIGNGIVDEIYSRNHGERLSFIYFVYLYLLKLYSVVCFVLCALGFGCCVLFVFAVVAKKANLKRLIT